MLHLNNEPILIPFINNLSKIRADVRAAKYYWVYASYTRFVTVRMTWELGGSSALVYHFRLVSLNHHHYHHLPSFMIYFKEFFKSDNSLPVILTTFSSSRTAAQFIT